MNLVHLAAISQVGSGRSFGVNIESAWRLKNGGREQGPKQEKVVAPSGGWNNVMLTNKI